MPETSGAIPTPGVIGRGTGPGPSGGLVARFVPLVALFGSIISTIALALILTRAFGPLRPSLPLRWTLTDQGVEWVIPPGHEAEILRLVVHGADDEIPQTERPSIADIQVIGATIVLTFDGHPDGRLTIQAANAFAEGFLRADAITAAWSSGSVPEPIRRYVAAIAKAPGWRELWAPPNAETPTGPKRWISERSGWMVVLRSLIAGNIVAALLLVAGRRRLPPAGDAGRADSEPLHDARLSPLALSIALMALAVAVFAVAHFHFRMDDYPFLVRAAHSPSQITETRVLSTMVHYQIGVRLGGGRLWFAVSNLAFLGAMCTCWSLLVHRLGLSRDASVIAGALFALGPGTFFLLRSGNGVEHLSATACLMLVLLLTDLAAREGHRPMAWRYGLLALALCLSLLGVLMKLPLMVVLPPSCWLWGRWLVERPASPLHRSVTYLAFLAVVGGAVFVLPSGGMSTIGFLPSRYALAAIVDRVSRFAVAVVALLVLGAIWPPNARSGTDAAPGSLASVAGLLWSPVGRLPLVIWALLTSATWFLPFALHAGYEGWAYYGMLAAAPLSAVGAVLIARAADQWSARGWRSFAAAGIACIILLPLGEIRWELRQAATELVPRWLDGVHILSATRSRPERIVVVPTCNRSSPLGAEMDAIFRESGIWWATGWYDVPVEFRDDALPAGAGIDTNVVTLGYCSGRPATIESPRRIPTTETTVQAAPR